jgi:hypothetical protein
MRPKSTEYHCEVRLGAAPCDAAPVFYRANPTPQTNQFSLLFQTPSYRKHDAWSQQSPAKGAMARSSRVHEQQSGYIKQKGGELWIHQTVEGFTKP